MLKTKTMTKTISRELADYVLSLGFSDLPLDVVHEAKRRVLDTFGCALGALDCPPARGARELAQGVTARNGATLIGSAQKTTADLAAFTNGILARYLDYNDTYLAREPAHPSDNIPAVLAVAEAGKRGGRDVIAAIVAAYEVQTRLCDAASLRARGWDHVAYVSISSALAASRLMGLAPELAANAVSLAVTPNTPLRQTRVGELSMWKGCAAPNAARNGVFAAYLARAGVTGPREVFEGELGFFNQVSGPFELDIGTFGGGGGRGGGANRFRILDTYIKHYPSEYHSQACIEACIEISKELGAGGDIGDKIEAITIETYDACVDIIAGDPSKWDPGSRETADHSLPYSAAVALTDGLVGLEQFSPERIADPVLNGLVKKVEVRRNAAHTAEYPAALPCMVEVALKDGNRITKTVTYPRGHPENPMSDSEVEVKYAALAEGVLEKGRSKELIEKIWNLDDISDIGELMEFLNSAIPGGGRGGRIVENDV